MKSASAVQRPVRRFGDADFVAAYGDAWSDTDTLLEFYAPDGEYVDKASGVVIKGPEAMRRFMRVYLGFSPDCTVTFTNVIKGAHGFAAEWVWAGKFDGAKPLRLHGRLSPLDGSSFSVDGVSFCSVNKDGQILRHVDYWDSALWIANWERA
jgi:steroid delta-isomerase-like uncharacterized protein